MISKIVPLLLTFGLASFERRIMSVVSAIGLMIVSMFFVMLAIVFGLMSMFFALADMDSFIAPSLITAGVTILIAILTGMESRRVMIGRRYRDSDRRYPTSRGGGGI